MEQLGAVFKCKRTTRQGSYYAQPGNCFYFLCRKLFKLRLGFLEKRPAGWFGRFCAEPFQ